MAIARANGKLKCKQPKLSARQRIHVLGLARTGDHTIAELAELFSVSRATIHREIARARRRGSGTPARVDRRGHPVLTGKAAPEIGANRRSATFTAVASSPATNEPMIDREEGEPLAALGHGFLRLS
jgi:transposase-like protein